MINNFIHEKQKLGYKKNNSIYIDTFAAKFFKYSPRLTLP
jgi:hypothetical protein